MDDTGPENQVAQEAGKASSSDQPEAIGGGLREVPFRRFVDPAATTLNTVFVLFLSSQLLLSLWEVASARSPETVFLAASKAIEFLILTCVVVLLPLRLSRHGLEDAARWVRRLTAAYGLAASAWALTATSLTLQSVLSLVVSIGNRWPWPWM